MGDEQVKFILEDPLSLNQIELCYPIGASTQQSRRYHVKEALVIGVRRLLDKAIDEKLIDLMPSELRGVSTSSKTSLTGASSRTGVTTALDVW